MSLTFLTLVFVEFCKAYCFRSDRLSVTYNTFNNPILRTFRSPDSLLNARLLSEPSCPKYCLADGNPPWQLAYRYLLDGSVRLGVNDAHGVGTAVGDVKFLSV